MRKSTPPAAIAMLAAAFWCTPAFAYIDPNASSILFQMFAPVAAVFALTMLFLRDKASAAWRWVASRLFGLRGKSEQ